LPDATTYPATGRIEPVYTLLSQHQRDALTLTWQQRLATLVSLAGEQPDVR
jgi:hypothetical protein